MGKCSIGQVDTVQVLYYLSGVVNCTPGLLYACTRSPNAAPVPADPQGVPRSLAGPRRSGVSLWLRSTLLPVSEI